MKKKKLLFVTKSDYNSAWGIRARYFSKYCSKEFDVSIIYKDGKSKIKNIIRFTLFLLKKRPHIVYCIGLGYITGSVILLSKILCSKIILEPGDLVYELSKSIGGRIFIELYIIKIMEKLIWRISDIIAAEGQCFKKYIENQGFRNVYSIPQGIDISIIKPMKPNIELKNKLKINDCLTIGIVGSFIYSKKLGICCYGWDIIEAINYCKDKPIKVIFIGKGDGIDWLKDKAKLYNIEDKVIFLGFISYNELPKYLSIIDICLSTQSNDLVGNVRTTFKLPLYLACNKFILATDVGEASIVLPKSMLLPYNGVVDYEYPKRLAKKIEEILANRTILKEAEKGYDLAKKYFDYDMLSKKVYKIIKNLSYPQ